MKHITLKFSIFSIVLISLVLWSCKEELPVRDEIINKPITFPSSTFNQNPLEWAGIQHNLLYDSLVNNLDYSVWDSTWIDTNFVDSSIKFINFQNSYLENLGKEYLFLLGDLDALTDKIIYDVTIANHITVKEKNYALKMINFSIKTLSPDSAANSQEVLDSIYSIEDDILNETWNENEMFAFFCISMMKHSYEKHIEESSSLYKDDNIRDSNRFIRNLNYKRNKLTLQKLKVVDNRTRAGVCGLVDWTVGAGIFLGSTSASGGLGIIAGAKLGVAWGSAASGLTDILGAHLDWWDSSIW